MKHEIKLIALDLDGTLLNSEKKLSARNYAALERAAALGIQIVPCTGRLLCALPEAVRGLPFLHYAICVNGAQVVDAETGQTLCRADIPHERGMEVFRTLSALPGVYDCYMDGQGWMDAAMYDRLEEFAGSPQSLAFLRSIRTPVPDFLGYMAEKKRDFQKIQIFFHTREERMRYEAELSGPLGDLNLTSSCANNIEINSRLAAKGEAMAALCRTLDFGPENAMCFGDGTNDISMLRLAGVGVAMENAEPCVKEAADVVTASCDEDGVAQMIERTLL